MNGRLWLVLPALARVALWHTPVTAQIPIPTLATCEPATAPQLPARWRAVGLMMPLHQGQLDVGEFIYDATLPAMRATVYGLESGAVDLLITDKDTYTLSGPHHAPTQCTSLGKKLRPPSPQWLSDQAVCSGESPLGTQPVQWWQTPGSGHQATWHWFSTKTRLPWRSLFLTRALDPAIIGDYAMIHFPTFTPLPATDLPSLRDWCAKTAKPNTAELESEIPTAREFMAIRNKAAEAERTERIGKLIPGLGHDACSHTTSTQWPERFGMAAVITPIKFNEGPYSALIYYDWSQAETQLAYMYQGRPPVLQGLISLKKRVGYRIKLPASGAAVCQAVLPGIVRPDWMKAAWCECKGVIKHNADLSPNAETKILSCPIKWQGQRVMWSWYTTEGRPVIFMEAAPEGGGLMLADYHDWLPGQTAQAADFELPNVCLPSGGGSPGGGGASYSNVSCSDCHTTLQ